MKSKILVVDDEQPIRNSLEKAFAGAGHSVVCAGSAEEALDVVQEEAGRILAIDDCIEEVHRRLMICYYRNRRRGKALRQYNECCEALREKLGAEPAEETERLYRRILSGRL